MLSILWAIAKLLSFVYGPYLSMAGFELCSKLTAASALNSCMASQLNPITMGWISPLTWFCAVLSLFIVCCYVCFFGFCCLRYGRCFVSLCSVCLLPFQLLGFPVMVFFLIGIFFPSLPFWIACSTLLFEGTLGFLGSPVFGLLFPFFVSLSFSASLLSLAADELVSCVVFIHYILHYAHSSSLGSDRWSHIDGSLPKNKIKPIFLMAGFWI